MDFQTDTVKPWRWAEVAIELSYWRVTLSTTIKYIAYNQKFRSSKTKNPLTQINQVYAKPLHVLKVVLWNRIRLESHSAVFHRKSPNPHILWDCSCQPFQSHAQSNTAMCSLRCICYCGLRSCSRQILHNRTVPRKYWALDGLGVHWTCCAEGREKNFCLADSSACEVKSAKMWPRTGQATSAMDNQFATLVHYRVLKYSNNQ